MNIEDYQKQFSEDDAVGWDAIDAELLIFQDNNPLNKEQIMTLNEIAWSFSSKTYSSQEEFNREIIDYQKTIFKTDEKWKPNEIVFDFPELNIQYEAWITDASQLLNNETLLDEEDVFDEDNSDEGMFQVETTSHFKADNGENFTALEFLFKTHNQQANKEFGDHIFFEGTDENPNLIDGLPLCYIACGS